MILSSLTQDCFGLFLFYTLKVQYHNPIFNATLFNPVFNKIPIKTCEMVESNTSSSVADLHGKLSGAHFLLTKIFIKF